MGQSCLVWTVTAKHAESQSNHSERDTQAWVNPVHPPPVPQPTEQFRPERARRLCADAGQQRSNHVSTAKSGGFTSGVKLHLLVLKNGMAHSCKITEIRGLGTEVQVSDGVRPRRLGGAQPAR